MSAIGGLADNRAGRDLSPFGQKRSLQRYAGLGSLTSEGVIGKAISRIFGRREQRRVIAVYLEETGVPSGSYLLEEQQLVLDMN